MSGIPMINTETPNPEGNHLSAISFMMIAVLGMSFMPLIVSLASGSENPFLVSAGLRVGTCNWIHQFSGDRILDPSKKR